MKTSILTQQSVARFLAALSRSGQLPPAVAFRIMRALIRANASKQLIIIIAGPPGSGKGCMNKRIRRWLGSELFAGFASSGVLDDHWNSGRLAPEYVAELRAIRDSGGLVPDDAVRDAYDYGFALKTGVREPTILFLDGAIRAVPQLPMMYGYALVRQRDIGVIELEASDEECIKRQFARPEAATRADTANAHGRLMTYHKVTEPALRLARHDLRWRHHVINTEQNSPFGSAFRALKHLTRLVVNPMSDGELASLVQRAQAV